MLVLAHRSNLAGLGLQALALLGSACMALVYVDAGTSYCYRPLVLGGEARPPSCAMGLTRPMGGLLITFSPAAFRFFFLYILRLLISFEFEHYKNGPDGKVNFPN